MLRPILFIGLGGAGGKTLRAIKQQLLVEINGRGFPEGIPDAWQFLHIDTPIMQDGQSFPAPMLFAQEYHSAVRAGMRFQDVINRIENHVPQAEKQELLAGWGTPLPVVQINQSPTTSRAAGRLLLISDLENTFKSIQRAMNQMLSREAYEQLKRASGNRDVDFTPRAFIVSSLGGTSGSGMFLDVAELVRLASAGSHGTQVTSILYTPDIFEEALPHYSYISANSFGAMNELLATSWIHDSRITEQLYARFGLARLKQTHPTRPGGEKCILIGASNKSGTNLLSGPDSMSIDNVFLSIGQALSGIAVDDFAIELLEEQSFTIDNSGLAPEDIKKQTTAFTGMGFAKLSLGADYIVNYVADALTKAQVKILLWPDFDQNQLAAGQNPQSLIQKAVEQRWPDFLASSGLSELGTEGQITEAMCPEDWENGSRELINSIVNSVVKGKPLSLSKFILQLWDIWTSELPELASDVNRKTEERARAWIPSIQKGFSVHIANELSLSGYLVTTNLAQRLYDHLKDEVLAELLYRKARFDFTISRIEPGFLLSKIQVFASGITEVSGRDSNFNQNVAEILNKAAQFQTQAQMLELTIKILEDFLDGFLAPLIKSLEAAHSELQYEKKYEMQRNGRSNPFQKMPEWGCGTVPQRYYPGNLECALIEPSEYESIYEHYAAFDSGINPPFEDSVGCALMGVPFGEPRGDSMEQTLAQVMSPWITRVRDAQSEKGQAASIVKWHFPTNLEELGERNRKWLKRPNGSFAKFTAMPIAEYLDAKGVGAEIKEEREKKFISEFQAMLSLCQPLVHLNENAMPFVKIVGTNDPVDSIIYRTTRLPFDMSSPLGRICTEILQMLGEDIYSGSFHQKWFNPSGKETALFAAATTKGSVPVWAIASLTDPILNKFAEFRNIVGDRHPFWQGRRARPLVEAIPFEREIRQSIIAGWIIAGLFGMQKDQIPKYGEGMPRFLQVAGKRLAEFGKSGDPKTIEIYLTLKHIGRERSRIMHDWIIDGIEPEQDTVLNKILRESAENPADRQAALLLTIKSQSQLAWHRYDDLSWDQTPEIFELKEDLNLVWKDITSFVERLAP